MPKQFRIRLTAAALVLGSFMVAGCSDDGGLNATPLSIAATEEESGSGQTGQAGQQLDAELRVIVTRDGEPEADVEVQWLTANRGSFSPGTSVTDASGIATTLWTLGPDEGGQSANARLVGATGSPVPFSANALGVPNPPPGGDGPPLANRPAR
ncbi:MAG: Ig-like domain-containing protein [Gemmatimonadales bacterium]|nr:Ig-like domain-containing protein [Gemmatimonadales bacterium]